MTVHVRRTQILSIVSEALGEIVDIMHFPVYWEEDAGEFLAREVGKLGAFVQLSASTGRDMGSEWVTYEKGPDAAFVTVYREQRQFGLTVRCESDPADPIDNAGEIVEHIRTRLEKRAKYINKLVEIGVSVLSSGTVIDVPAFWDGRRVTGAVVELTCMSTTEERDTQSPDADGATPGGGDYYDDLQDIKKVDP